MGFKYYVDRHITQNYDKEKKITIISRSYIFSDIAEMNPIIYENSLTLLNISEKNVRNLFKNHHISFRYVNCLD